MKQLFFTFILLVMTIATTQAQKPSDNQTIYQFTVTDISGKPFDLSTLKGKKVMIVNTASKCGLTPQYKELEALYERYKDKDFVIIGFPANNFLGQEPGDEQNISKRQRDAPFVSVPHSKGKKWGGRLESAMELSEVSYRQRRAT